MNDVMPRTRCYIMRNKNCRISCLPDELLISILSCLNFHEAARTCILSRRWRYLWNYTSCNIEYYKPGEGLVYVAEKLRNSLTPALKLHQAPTIEQFKVGFLYPKGIPPDFVDSWIDFAIRKQVKVFELNLALGLEHFTSGVRYTYSIPDVQKLLSISGEANLLKACTTLKSVRFVDVRVTQEVVEFLLSNCPLLETLCIEASGPLENLRVIGSLPKLSSMVISNCNSLKGVVVNAPSLVSFTYIGCRNIPLAFKNVPLLTELNLGGCFADSFILNRCHRSDYCQNLTRLKLDVTEELSVPSKVRRVPSEFPQMCHLKELELNITTGTTDGLCFFTFLIKSSPQLSRLTIRLLFLPGHDRTDLWGTEIPPRHLLETIKAIRDAANRDEKEATTFYHQCLEVVKLIGFIGVASDCDLAFHLLRAAPSLKKMILVSDISEQQMKTFDVEQFWPFPRREKAIRKCVKKLKANLPPGAELVTEGPGFSRKK